MSFFNTTFKFQQGDTHCRERTMPHSNAFSRQAFLRKSASAPFNPHRERHVSSSTISTHIRQQTTMPAVLQIDLQHRLSCHLNSQGFTKAKRVSDPLNKAVRDSLCGDSTYHVDKIAPETPYFTSGSGHDIDSVVTDFLEEQEENEPCSSRPRLDFSEACGSDAESSGVHDINIDPFLGEQIREMLQGVSNCCTRHEQMLLRDVTDALRMAQEKAGFVIENEGQKSSLRTFVMRRLRCEGYNAGLCKSRWEKTNGYPAGDYEFIDVVEGSRSMGKGNRLLVDIDFRSQFEIARPTDDYAALFEELPVLFVGRADKVLQMIRIMCDAARRSLKTSGMHIPPWRKARYMQAKWVGSYKRTTNSISTLHHDGENAAMGALKCVGMGMGWDASFTHQMHLHFQQAVREAKGKEQLLEVPMDLQSWQPQGKCRLAVETEHGIIESPVRGTVKKSGLATALAEAALRL